jgi:uncharacterized protein
MDAFGDPVRSEAELRALVPEPTFNAYRKQVDRLDEHCRALISHSPLVLVATSGPDGACDVSPRGGPPGFVGVLDESRLAIPEAPGNRRLDSLANVIANPHVGLLFLVPGRDETLRVNGRATITTDPDLLAAMPLGGKTPVMALGVQADEVFTHCGKALMRSELWDAGAWPGVSDLPSFAEILRDHVGETTLEETEARIHESYTQRLW